MKQPSFGIQMFREALADSSLSSGNWNQSRGCYGGDSARSARRQRLSLKLAAESTRKLNVPTIMDAFTRVRERKNATEQAADPESAESEDEDDDD